MQFMRKAFGFFAKSYNSHVLKIEFDLDHDLLGKILDNVSRCECHPEFDISYAIKDKEAVKNKLLEKAVKDSRVKA